MATHHLASPLRREPLREQHRLQAQAVEQGPQPDALQLHVEVRRQTAGFLSLSHRAPHEVMQDLLGLGGLGQQRGTGAGRQGELVPEHRFVVPCGVQRQELREEILGVPAPAGPGAGGRTEDLLGMRPDALAPWRSPGKVWPWACRSPPARR